ncbi:MAG: hypothetical protein R3E83_06590 [Burkholderiaceae bacterium]
MNGEDQLAFTPTGNITGVWNPATATLSLTGSDTPANYEAALRTVTYENLSDAPSTLDRNIAFSITDGLDASVPQSRDITVTAVFDPPQIANLAADTVSYSEADPAVLIDQGADAAVSDPDSVQFGGGSVSASFVSGEDGSEDQLLVLDEGNAPGQIGVTGSTVSYGGLAIGMASGGSAGTPLTVTLNANADAAAVSSLIRRIAYLNIDTDSPTLNARTVRFVILDDTGTASAAIDTQVTVTGVNDAPGLSAIEAGQLIYTENDPATPITASLVVTDVDSATLASATVALTANYVPTEDTLSFTSAGNIIGSWDSGSGVLTLSGIDTIAAYQNALRSVSYQNSSDNPDTGIRTISIQVDDGALSSGVAQRDIRVDAVADAPTLANIEGSALLYTENDPATQITGTLTMSDPDSAAIVSASAAIAVNYVNGEDLLEFVDTGSIVGSWNAGTGTLTLTGVDTLAAYEAALRSVTYRNVSNDPSASNRTVAFRADDGSALLIGRHPDHQRRDHQ